MKGKFLQVVIVALVMAGMGWGFFAGYNKIVGPAAVAAPTNSQLVAVRYGNISSSVTASGSLVYSNKAQLTFGSAGAVGKVAVQVGDVVTEGQELAKLDDTALLALRKAVVQAEMSLQTAKGNLAKLENTGESLTVAQAGAAVINAKLALQTAEDNLKAAQDPNSVQAAQAGVVVANAKVALQTAEDNLKTAQNPNTLQVAQANAAVANARVALQTAQDNLAKAQVPYSDADLAAAEAAVIQAEQKLTNVQKQGPLDIADAQVAVDKAYSAYVLALANYNTGAFSIDVEGPKRVWERAKLNLDIATQNAAKSLSEAQANLDKAQQTLADMKAPPDPLKVDQAQKQLDLATANLAGAEQTLANTETGVDALKLEQAQKQVEVARANLASAEQTLANSGLGGDALKMEQARNQVDVSRAGLANAESALKEATTAAGLQLELSKIEADQAQAALDRANSNLAAATMKAPFDGVVSIVNVVEGQNVNANAVVIEIADPTALELNAIVGEIDVATVKAGQRATVSLDALSDVAVSGQVVNIAPVGKAQQGVVSYTVTIQVTPPRGAQLKEGMSATADIIVEQMSNVLVIPDQAIRGTASSPTVVVTANGQAEPRSVTLGASDGSYTAVTAGLSAGELVELPVSSSTRSTGQLPGSATNRLLQGGGGAVAPGFGAGGR